MADVDDETRQYLRIWLKVPRILVQLVSLEGSFKAADTGSHSDYQQAETIFDLLPIDKRMAIKEFAETEARLVEKIRYSKTANDPYDLDRYFTSSFCFSW